VNDKPLEDVVRHVAGDELHAGALANRFELDAELDLPRDPRRLPAVQSLGIVAPPQDSRWFVLRDGLVDLEPMASPTPAHTLLPTDRSAGQEHSGPGSAEPLRKALDWRDEIPYVLDGRLDSSLANDLDHGESASGLVLAAA